MERRGVWEDGTQRSVGRRSAGERARSSPNIPPRAGLPLWRGPCENVTCGRTGLPLRHGPARISNVARAGGVGGRSNAVMLGVHAGFRLQR